MVAHLNVLSNFRLPRYRNLKRTCIYDYKDTRHKHCSQQRGDFIEAHIAPTACSFSTPYLEGNEYHGDDIGGNDGSIESCSEFCESLVLGDC